MSNLSVACKSCGTPNTIEAKRVLERAPCPRCRQPVVISAPVEVDPATAKGVVKASPLPVMMVLYSPWNNQSTMALPVLDDVAKRHAGKLVIVRVNTHMHPQFLTDSGGSARDLPVIVVYRAGSEKRRATGIHSAQQIEGLI